MGDVVKCELVPCLFPSFGPPPASNGSSIELAGRLDAIDVCGRNVDEGRVVVDWLNDIDVCGRLLNADGGRDPGPILLAKLLLDALRDDVDVVREETEDVKEVFRAPLRETPAPTRDVPFTVDLVPGMTDLVGSPARSTKVFLLGSASVPGRMEAKD